MPERSPELPDSFDQSIDSLHGLPDVVSTRPSIITATTLLGRSQTWIVRSFRQSERGDTVFLQLIDGDGSMRLVLPPTVAKAISQQRDSLTTKSRSKAAKRKAQDRKDRGEEPAFAKARAAKAS